MQPKSVITVKKQKNIETLVSLAESARNMSYIRGTTTWDIHIIETFYQIELYIKNLPLIGNFGFILEFSRM